jgi:adenylosuccinate lyase
MTTLVDGLVVHRDRMLENLDLSHGLVFSQSVLLALVASGMDRDSAYRIVQRDARLAWDEAKPLRMVLESDPDVPLSSGQLDEAFSLERALRHARRAVDALDDIDQEVP